MKGIKLNVRQLKKGTVIITHYEDYEHYNFDQSTDPKDMPPLVNKESLSHVVYADENKVVIDSENNGKWNVVFKEHTDLDDWNFEVANHRKEELINKIERGLDEWKEELVGDLIGNTGVEYIKEMESSYNALGMNFDTEKFFYELMAMCINKIKPELELYNN